MHGCAILLDIRVRVLVSVYTHVVKSWWQSQHVGILGRTDVDVRPLLQQRFPLALVLYRAVRVKDYAHPQGAQLVPQLTALVRDRRALRFPQGQPRVAQELFGDQGQHASAVRVLGPEHLADLGEQGVELLVGVVIAAVRQIRTDLFAHLFFVQVPRVFVVRTRAGSRVRCSCKG